MKSWRRVQVVWAVGTRSATSSLRCEESLLPSGWGPGSGVGGGVRGPQDSRQPQQAASRGPFGWFSSRGPIWLMNLGVLAFSFSVCFRGRGQGQGGQRNAPPSPWGAGSGGFSEKCHSLPPLLGEKGWSPSSCQVSKAPSPSPQAPPRPHKINL